MVAEGHDDRAGVVLLYGADDLAIVIGYSRHLTADLFAELLSLGCVVVPMFFRGVSREGNVADREPRSRIRGGDFDALLEVCDLLDHRHLAGSSEQDPIHHCAHGRPVRK